MCTNSKEHVISELTDKDSYRGVSTPTNNNQKPVIMCLGEKNNLITISYENILIILFKTISYRLG